MARTEAGTQLTVQHRRLQLRISAAVSQDYLRIWPLWTGDSRSFGRLTAATVPLVRAAHGTSSGLASGYYRAYRFAEGVDGAATPVLAPFNTDAVVASMYVTGQAQTRASLVAGMSPLRAREQALIRTMGAVTRHALNGGRDTVVGSVRADRQAVGWQRVTSGKPCHFCTMLSSRGPVYKQQTVGFRAHDHCACTSEPLYRGGEWNPRNVEHRELWNRVASGEPDPLNALRRHLAAA